MKKFTKIYLDMDGVLADFDSKFETLTEQTPAAFKAEHGSSMFWSRVYEDPTFFEDLDKFAHTRHLVHMCRDYSERPVSILSSPSRINTPLCMIQKRNWIDNNIGERCPAIFDKKKSKYARDGILLIDDHQDNLVDWVKDGGVAFHFKTDTSMAELEKWMKDFLK